MDIPDGAPCAPAAAFNQLFTMTDMAEYEKACGEWGVTRRIALCVATKSRAHLATVLSSLADAEENAVFALIDGVGGLIEHHEGLVELFRCVQARLFLSAGDAFGVPDEAEVV